MRCRILHQPSRKALKNPKIVKVSRQRTQNNGDIDIIPSKRASTANSHLPEELISQGIRYQVPEQIVILDFWSRVKRDKYGMYASDCLVSCSSSSILTHCAIQAIRAYQSRHDSRP